MSIRFPWLLGLVLLVSIALLMACGSHYAASSDGLLIVPSLGSGVLQSFSFSLSSGHISAISNPPVLPGPPPQGAPTSIVLDPTGTFAFVAYGVPCTGTANPKRNVSGLNGVIASYKINSNGTLTSIGTTKMLGNPGHTGDVCNLTSYAGNPPVALALDSAGKLLFAANAFTTVSFTDTTTNPPTTTSTTVAGTVSVFSVGANASLTEVAGSSSNSTSPFAVPVAGTTPPNPSSLAVTHTTFPVPGTPAACAAQTAPTAEFLYVADSAGDDVVGYTVSSSGGLTPIAVTAGVGFATGTTPSGIVVDPCNRFVYVANQGSNNVSAYNICSAIGIGACTSNDWSLVPVSGSPFSAGTSPGPLVVDPFGNFLYVLDTGQSAVSGYKIAQVSGALTALTPATVGVGSQPVSLAIRGDDNWLFVTNYISATVSQFIITPASGALTPAGTGIVTDNFPWGVAVK
jgi:6-phosphogluconolactonase (cycloisomerase 2 family)